VREIALAATLLAICSTTTMAADMPMKVKAPVVAPAPSWAGFYIGGHAGGAHADHDGSFVALPAGFGLPAVVGGGVAGAGINPTGHDFGGDGWIAGLHAGYNWQFGRTVLGVEGDVTFLDRNSVNAQNAFATCCAQVVGSLTLQAKYDWLATARLRLGYTFDRLMLYVTGGAAFTDVSYRAAYTDFGIMGVAQPAPQNFGRTDVGVAAGAGAEWMIALNWILRAEYLYYHFEGGNSVSLPIVGGNCTVALNCRFVATANDLDLHTVRAGLSYKFGGPVVAKY
jgi:outer membrane immunogenic protein